MALNDFTLKWCKSYDVLHIVRTGNKTYKDVWDRLIFCKKCCDGQKLEFYNKETQKRCRLSISAIKIICDDQYQYFLKTGHKELIQKIKGEDHGRI